MLYFIGYGPVYLLFRRHLLIIIVKSIFAVANKFVYSPINIKMKKHLSLIVAICMAFSSFAVPWDIKSPKHVTAKESFEDVTINWYVPEYYYADYWYPGQAAGYYFFLDLSGVQSATWELSIDIETTIGGVTSMKTFVFTVPSSGPYYSHSHVLEMISQMSSGETIPWDADMTINHWWIVS